MHAAAARYVSVSELYSTDEVELLLDEIRDLEPTSCRGEDIQDFEIAGSGLGAAGSAGGSGARSPAGTERSWDSHAQYRRAPPPPPRPLAPVYCRLRHLLTVQGAIMLFIVLCSTGSCGCVWAGAGLQVWALPGAGRVRLLLLGALTTALLHMLLLLLRVTSLDALLPLHWAQLRLAAHVWGGGALVCGALGSLHALLALPDFRLAPVSLLVLLYTASGLGLAAGGLCCALVGLALRRCAAARAPPSPPSPPSPPLTQGSRASAAYRAVPAAPQPSTSRAPL